MSLPTIIASNQTGSPVTLTRLGLTVPASGTLTLTAYAYVDEILHDESLHSAIVADSILLDYGQGVLTKGDSLKFFNIITQEVRISVRAMSTTNVGSLSGAGSTMDTSVTLVADDRVLLTGQGTASQNGVWVVKSGAWVRPDDFGTSQSAAAAMVAVQEGTLYAGQVWLCTALSGSDVIGTNNLPFAQISGSGGGGVADLQGAYDGGSTITTAGTTDIAFTLSSGDFTVNSGSVLFGGATPLTAFAVDSGTMSLDSTDTTNLTMTANNAGDKTLAIAASNSGVGTGVITMTADGTIDLDAVGALSLNSSGAAINIGNDAVAQAINIGTGAAARTITVGNASSTTTLDLNAGTGGVLVDSTGVVSLDGVGASNFTTDSGTLTLATTTSGAVNVSSAGAVDVQAAGDVTLDSSGGTIGVGTDVDTGAINIGTAGARVLTVGSNTGATSVTVRTGTGGLLLDSPTTTVSGNLLVNGTTTTVHSEVVNVADNFLYLNADYTTVAGMAGGMVVNSLPTTTVDVVATGGFVARAGAANAYVAVAEAVTAIAVASNGATLPQATINVDSTTGFPASGTVYLTTTNGVEAVTYTGVTGTSFTGCSGGIGTLATGDLVSTSATALPVEGDFIQVSGASNQSNDGLYEVLSNLNGVLTIKGLGTTAGTFEFTQNDFITDTTVLGSITVVNVGVQQVSAAGVFQYGYGSNAGAFTFADVTTGAAALSLQSAYAGGNTVTTSGGNSLVVAGSEALSVTATGGLVLTTGFNFDGTSFDVQMTGDNGFSIDGTASSNVTATNTASTTPVVMTVAASNTGATSGDATVQINATSTNGAGIIDLNADDTITLDVLSGGAINIGTAAVASTTTVGNSTGASGVIVSSGTEKVVVDGVTYYGNSAGAPTATVGGFADGDKYYDTNLDAEMRYDATRTKWLSVESMTLQVGRNGVTAVDQYYRGTDGRVMSSALGYYMPHNGTVVGFGYTRSDLDAATFDIVEGGTSRATLASSAVAGVSNALNGDFSAGGVLAVVNQAGGNSTSDVMAWVKVKWRA